MAEIGMTLGDNFGQLMHQMSWEKLFEFDPEDAVKIWIESFGGTLLFGYNSTSCSMEKFKEIEDEYHMAKLFSAYGWNF